MDKETEVILKVIPIAISLIALFVTIVSTIIGLPKLYDMWKGLRIRRILLEKLRRGPFDEEVIKRSTRYFIRPECQNLNPAEEIELRDALDATREDLFKKIDEFIESKNPIKHLIVYF